MSKKISREDGSGWTEDGKPLEREGLPQRCREWVAVAADVGLMADTVTTPPALARCAGIEGHARAHHIILRVTFEPTRGTKLEEYAP